MRHSKTQTVAPFIAECLERNTVIECFERTDPHDEPSKAVETSGTWNGWNVRESALELLNIRTLNRHQAPNLEHLNRRTVA